MFIRRKKSAHQRFSFIQKEPSCYSRCSLLSFPALEPLSVIPTLEPPSVIPDVFNRESKVFPMQCHTNEGTKEKDTGFPLKTCGNDRGGLRE